MEKIIKSSDDMGVGYGSAYVIYSGIPDRLVGKILTIIEALGLQEKQENSLKDILRQEIYRTLDLDTWIPPQLHNVVKEFVIWHEKENPHGGPVPVSDRLGSVRGDFELHYKE